MELQDLESKLNECLRKALLLQTEIKNAQERDILLTANEKAVKYANSELYDGSWYDHSKNQSELDFAKGFVAGYEYAIKKG